jgi:hypothetical protein
VTDPRRAAVGLVIVLALMTTAPAQAAAPQTWESRIAAAERYAERRAGTISFAVVDEANRLHGSRARVAAYSASLLKPMLLVAYLRRSGVRDRPLRQRERDLLTPMIRRSDNTNVPRLIAIVGERRLQNLAEAAGMEHFVLHMPYWGSSETTPRGQARFLHRIEGLVPATHRRYAMRLLATVIPAQRWGVGRVPPAGWRLYFKGGWSSGTGLVDHQVALYRAGGERFSLALFTRFDPSHEYGKETLRGLAARLLRGVPTPGHRIAPAGRAAPSGRSLVTARPDCEAVTIRPDDGETRTYTTDAASCGGFQLVSARSRAIWSWAEEGESHLSAADAASPTVVDLGSFDSTDPLGPLAGSGGILAYAHGAEVSTVGGPACPASADALGAGGGRIAVALGSTIEVVDPATCALERTIPANDLVAAVALDDRILASLSEGPAGRIWLEWFRLSTGSRLGKKEVFGKTRPRISVRSPWILYRSAHTLRVLGTESGRARAVWRPANPQLGPRLLGRRIEWVENDGEKARTWTLRLPAED